MTSSLVTRIASLLNIDNPLLETTDWKQVNTAMKNYIGNFWRDIKKKTPALRDTERGGKACARLDFRVGSYSAKL